MNLGQMHSRVSKAIKRGSSLDDIIPLWVGQAARLLEQNYTFSWMRRSANYTIAAGNVPLVLALSALVKSVEWVKQIAPSDASDGTVFYGNPLIGVEEDQITGINGGNPQGFWLEGQDGSYNLCFDAIPHEDYKFRARQAVFTDWPTDDDAAQPALLLRGEFALFSQTLVLFANEQRDMTMAATYASILNSALTVLLNSEEELKMSHQNDLKMMYSGLE